MFYLMLFTVIIQAILCIMVVSSTITHFIKDRKAPINYHTDDKIIVNIGECCGLMTQDEIDEWFRNHNSCE